MSKRERVKENNEEFVSIDVCMRGRVRERERVQALERETDKRETEQCLVRVTEQDEAKE